MRHTLTAVVALSLLAAACSPPSEFETRAEPERLGTDSGPPITTTGTMDTTSLPATTTTTVPPVDDPAYAWEHAPRRSCETRVYGALVKHETDVQVGPVRLMGAHSYAEVSPDTTFKVLVVIDGLHDALLVVSDEFADDIAVEYLQVPDLARRTTILPGCDDGLTMFSGGFDVGGPTCAAVDIYIDGSDEATRVWLPYATAECPDGAAATTTSDVLPPDPTLLSSPDGTSTCDPPSPVATWSGGLTESRGSGDFGLWGLLWKRPPWRVGEEVKVVFRVDSPASPSFSAIDEDGSVLDPTWGPNHHGTDASNYIRPGDEWGMAFTLPHGGCWALTVTTGATSAAIFLSL